MNTTTEKLETLSSKMQVLYDFHEAIKIILEKVKQGEIIEKKEYTPFTEVIECLIKDIQKLEQVKEDCTFIYEKTN